MQPDAMNGAESLVRTLVAGGVDVCFSNPGTSEMHFVAALDKVEGMRSILCLFEGGATGAADGWSRMTGRPGLTLLHLGPGLANGLANLHNAKKAGTPVVNVVGEHTTTHLAHDAPLTSDIEGLARPMSHWVKTGRDSRAVAAEGAEAITAARTAAPLAAGQIATLILPADTAWGPGGAPVSPAEPPPLTRVDDARLAEALAAIGQESETLLFLGGPAAREENLALAQAIAARTGARVMGRTSLARVERGAGRPALSRLPYPIDLGLAALKPFRTIVLVGTPEPVAFFGYPGKPSRLADPSTRILQLATCADDIPDVLARLAEAVGARATDAPRLALSLPAMAQDGRLTPENATAVIARLMPEHAIIVDESITSGRSTHELTATARPHDWLQITGGSIGIGPPLALGASVACPDRKVINLQADGSAMYTLQALWTQARLGADVVTVIWSNRSYQILVGELMNVGAGNPGRSALDMISLDNPAIDWTLLARGMGVPAVRAGTVAEFARAFEGAIGTRGPFLIEATI